MCPPPPIPTRTDHLFTFTTLFRSVRFLTFDEAYLALRFQNGPGHIGNGRYAGQPHFRFNFRLSQTVAPEIFFKQLSVTDDEPGLAIQHILHPRKKISHPTQEETPKGNGNDRQRGPRYAEVILSDTLLEDRRSTRLNS